MLHHLFGQSNIIAAFPEILRITLGTGLLRVNQKDGTIQGAQVGGTVDLHLCNKLPMGHL